MNNITYLGASGAPAEVTPQLSKETHRGDKSREEKVRGNGVRREPTKTRHIVEGFVLKLRKGAIKCNQYTVEHTHIHSRPTDACRR